MRINAAGQKGWELVLISPNSTAYLVREIEEEALAPAPRRTKRQAAGNG